MIPRGVARRVAIAYVVLVGLAAAGAAIAPDGSWWQAGPSLLTFPASLGVWFVFVIVAGAYLYLPVSSWLTETLGPAASWVAYTYGVVLFCCAAWGQALAAYLIVRDCRASCRRRRGVRYAG